MQLRRLSTLPALLIGLAALGLAAHDSLAQKDKHTATLVIIGKVSNTTNSTLGDRKLMVTVGDKKWTLHVQNNARVAHGAALISVHNIDLGAWVKGTGPQLGDLRQRTDRLDVIGTHGAYQKSRVYRSSQPDGYVTEQK